MIIYSHRGIDIDRIDQLAENSLEAFTWAASHGFGVELDLQLNSQGEIIIVHDPTATRWSNGKCNLKWSDIAIPQLRALENECGRIPTLKEVFDLAKKKSMHIAIHLKGSNQSPFMVNLFSGVLAQWKDLLPQILVFDCKVETAKVLREKFPKLDIAISVSTEEDMFYYNSLTSHTLYSLGQAIDQRAWINWAWLDEWKPGLYCQETFERLRKANLKSVVVSPELHKAENHPHSKDLHILEERWQSILQFKPDAICTDYPTRLAGLMGEAT